MKNLLIFLGIAAIIYWYKNRDKIAAGTSNNWLKSSLFSIFPTSTPTATTVTPATDAPITSAPTGGESTPNNPTGYIAPPPSPSGDQYTPKGEIQEAATFTSLIKPKSAFR